MKKPVIIVSVLALVLAAGIIYKLTITKLPVDKVLPGGAIAYIQISDVEKQINEFKNTRLWKNIRKIDIEMLMGKGGATKDQIERYKTSKSEMTSFLGSLVIDKYFGKEIAIAMYPTEIKEISPDTGLDFSSNLILVTRIKPETDFIEFLSKILNKFGQKYEITEENHNGRKITIVKLNGKVSLAYVRIKDLLVIKGSFPKFTGRQIFLFQTPMPQEIGKNYLE